MPLFTKTITAGVAALLSIPVFGAGIIAANYGSPILDHLVDIVNGKSTQTVASLNAPNWSFGAPLAQPVGVSAATTSGGTLASSTTWYFEVAALDGNGTTTVSAIASATTDASGNPPEAIQLSWAPVSGATGYAIEFSTSTPTNFTQYVLASTTKGIPNNSFTFGTSTGSFFGTNTLTDSTAFATKLNPIGQSYLNGGGLQLLGQAVVGTTSAASTTEVEINGAVRAQSTGTTTNCYAATAGDIFFNTSNSHAWGCDGNNWVKIY